MDTAQLANQSAGLQQGQQNNSGALAGSGLLSGALSNAYGVGTNQDNFGLNRASQTNGLLQPYLTKSNNMPAQQPVFGNLAGSALGGAAAGVGLLNQFNQLQGGGNYNSWLGNNAGVMNSQGLTPNDLLRGF